MSILTTLLAFVLALGLLITFHEFGHYIVARLCGVRVLRFSLGFGRVLLRRTDRHGCEFVLSAIPLGGYVKMLDDPAELPGGLTGEAFKYKSVWQRFAIVAAGPLANLLLAVLLYAVLGWAGTRQPLALLGPPPAGSPAALAGARAGDQIIAVDGEDAPTWTQARALLMQYLGSGGRAALTLQSPGGGARDIILDIPAGLPDDEREDFLQNTGVQPQQARARVFQVLPGGAAERAGLREGDVVTAVDGLPEPAMEQFIHAVQASPGQALQIMVQREGATVTLHARPGAFEDDEGNTVGRLDVRLEGDLPYTIVRHGVLGGLAYGAQSTWNGLRFSLRMMGRMVTGEVALKHISGPVTIADYAGQTARMGLASYMNFLAIISISIGLLNLLPIPMLDGGHLFYYVLEIVRRKPVPLRWMLIGQKIGVGLLAALMTLAFFNDFVRIFS
jgi:regulator of sigma E protease